MRKKFIKKEISKEEVKRMPVYLVLCKETIVDCEGNEKLYGEHFLGVYKTLNQAHYECRDSYYYVNHMLDERKEADEDFYFETDDNELTITTNLFQVRGLLNEGNPDTILVSKYEVIECML